MIKIILGSKIKINLGDYKLSKQSRIKSLSIMIISHCIGQVEGKCKVVLTHVKSESKQGQIFVPLHVLPGVGVWSAIIKVQKVYIIVCGFVCSVATSPRYSI